MIIIIMLRWNQHQSMLRAAERWESNSLVKSLDSSLCWSTWSHKARTRLSIDGGDGQKGCTLTTTTVNKDTHPWTMKCKNNNPTTHNNKHTNRQMTETHLRFNWRLTFLTRLTQSKPTLDQSVDDLWPFCLWISLFPSSRVTKAVPFRTISVMLFQAFGDRCSDGHTKFPAALFMITCTNQDTQTVWCHH